ncbi:hypothetical protein pCXcHC2016_06 [Xenohaliotis phage pCXc-HC2016]|nr:hypothetical protein pCXcHC2016_06 [Xenohaliotis phage pCXc-HC2016]
MHKLADMLKENVVIRGFEEGLKEGVDIECSVCLLGKEGLDAIITPNEECEVFNLKELCKDLFD